MTCHRPRQGTGVMKTSMLHSHTKLQRTVVHTHTELYTLYTIIHYYTLLYKVSPPPPRRWPGEQRGVEQGVVCQGHTSAQPINDASKHILQL